MAKAIFGKKYIHVDCGYEIITEVLMNQVGYKSYCPKHPNQDKYIVTFN